MAADLGEPSMGAWSVVSPCPKPSIK